MRVRGAVFRLRSNTAALGDAARMLGLIVGGIDDAHVHDLALLEPTTDFHCEARAVDTVDARGVELMCDTQDGAVWFVTGPNERVMPQQFLMCLPDDASVDRGEYACVDAYEKTLERINQLLERRDRRGGE